MQNRLCIRNDAYIGISSGSCSGSSSLKRFIEFKTRVAEVGKNIHPSRRKKQSFFLNYLICFVSNIPGFSNRTVLNENICLLLMKRRGRINDMRLPYEDIH